MDQIMKWWIILFGILITNPLFAKCKIDTHSFGTSAKKIQKSLDDYWADYEPIPGVNKEVTTNFEFICLFWTGQPARCIRWRRSHAC